MGSTPSSWSGSLRAPGATARPRTRPPPPPARQHPPVNPQPLGHHTSPKFEQFVRRIFVKYDTDKSGTIDSVELVVLLKELGEKTDSESVDAFMKEVDADHDGKIDFK